MMKNEVVNIKNFGLSDKANIAIAALAVLGKETITFFGTNSADVVFLKGGDGCNYIVQVKLRDAIAVVTKLDI